MNYAAPNELAAILRCPITRAALRPLNSKEVQDLNGRIRAKKLWHRDGTLVEGGIPAAFRAIGQPYVYAILDDILLMLPGLAIDCDRRTLNDTSVTLAQEKSQVQRFYDEVGWRRTSDDVFQDAHRWEDLRPVSRRYIQHCHRRVNRHLQPSGRYFLDAASGPVQYAEYLEYSAGYAARICVDISLCALHEAKCKIGERGIFILGDVTNLPLADGVIDGAVSLHTIYHVANDEQSTAVRELHRVLSPGRSAVIVYNWRSRAVKLASLPYKIVGGPWRILKKLANQIMSSTKGRAESRSAKGDKLFFHAHSYSWFCSQPWAFPFEIYVWRSMTVPMLRAYVHRLLLGRLLLAGLTMLEEAFPHMLGRFGAYPMIVVRNTSPSMESVGDDEMPARTARAA